MKPMHRPLAALLLLGLILPVNSFAQDSVKIEAVVARVIEDVEAHLDNPDHLYLRLQTVVRPAAEQGSANSQWLLGALYFVGVALLPEAESPITLLFQDYGKAAQWLGRAAEQGHADAQNYLGLLYLSGAGLPKDPQEAAGWFRRAADRSIATGAYWSTTESWYHLARWYFIRTGVPRDTSLAVDTFRQLAEAGDVDAQYLLGALYRGGEGVTPDDAESARWFRQAAEQGLAEAQFKLAQSYETGRGVPRDRAEAEQWYRRAAEQGFADAQYELARHLEGTAYSIENPNSWRETLAALAALAEPKDTAQAAQEPDEAAQEPDEAAEDSVQRAAEANKYRAEAERWYRSAAEQGHILAQHQLAERAFSVGDTIETLKWLYLVHQFRTEHRLPFFLDGEFAEVYGRVDELNQQLRDEVRAEQIAEARRRAAELGGAPLDTLEQKD